MENYNRTIKFKNQRYKTKENVFYYFSYFRQDEREEREERQCLYLARQIEIEIEEEIEKKRQVE